jgi:hypothetical protein
MRLLTKFRRTIALLGLWNTVLFVVSRTVDTVTTSRLRLVKYYFVAQPVTTSSASSHSEISRMGSFTLNWVGADCPALEQIERPASVLAARFAQGARCLLATNDNGEFAGFLWFVIGPYNEDEVRARFIPQPEGQAAWDFDVTIAPRFRMGRLFSYLWHAAQTGMAKSGVLFSFSRISAFNSASLASHQRLGGRIVGHATFLCLGGFQLMISSLKPRLHLSWRYDSSPELRVGGHEFWVDPYLMPKPAAISSALKNPGL